MPEERRHIAVMFTDIVGYTALMGSDEDKAFDMLKRNHTIHATLIKKHNGKLIKEVGDGTLASFPLASNAVRCAMDIQKEAKSQNIPLKIGIHQGEMVMVRADVLGDGVNVASRLQESAEEGCISISGAVFRDVKNKAGITADYLEDKTLKNVDEPVKVYKVHCEEIVPEPSTEQPIKKNKLLYYIIGGFFLLIVAILIWQFLPSKKTTSQMPYEVDKSIAVLPFKDLSAEMNNQYFCDGIMEGILNNLSKIEELRVISSTSVEKYRGGSTQSPQIGKELDVTYLLEASVFKSEDKIRVTTQLINVKNDEHIWSEQYDRELKDVFEVMSDISQEVASEVKVVIAPEVKKRIELIPTQNLDAYDLALKGQEFVQKGQYDSAIQFLQQAIEIDPQFAAAYVWMGLAYHQKVGGEKRMEYFEEYWGDTLKYYSDKALSINPDLAEGYWLRGKYYREKGDLDESISQYEKAIDLNPNYGDAYLDLANIHLYKGQYVQNLVNLEKAKILKVGAPDYSDVLYNIAGVYFCVMDYEKVESVVTEFMIYNPTTAYLFLTELARVNAEYEKMKLYIDKTCAFDSSRTCLLKLWEYYMYKGEFNQALKYINRWTEKIKERDDIVLRRNAKIAYILFKLGREEEATEYCNRQIEYSTESIRLKRTYASDGGAFYDMAGACALLGDKEKAIQSLHEMESRQTGWNGWLFRAAQNDSFLESLWQTEEFKQIIQRQEKKFAEIRAEIDRLEEEGLL